MPRLLELKKLYEQVRSEEAEYWDELRQTLRELLNSLASELGLDPRLHIGMNLGFIDEKGQFKRESSDNLPRKNLSLNFAVQLVLDIHESVIPPNLVTTEWSLRGVRDGISLTGENGKLTVYDDVRGAAKHMTTAFEAKISSYSPYTR